MGIMKSLGLKMGLLKTGGHGDGDQSPLKGEKAQILRNQWSGGMGYNPLQNRDHSSWLLALYCGDYNKTMSYLNNKSDDDVKMQLDLRESLLHVCGIFNVIIGARTLCGDNPLYKDIRKETVKSLSVKFEHIKILEKILELGANVHVKDVAGYTPLHHCLTAYGNSVTFSMAELLLKAGANPNLQNRFGATPMFEPLMNAKLDFVSLLLKFGGDPDIKDNDGYSCVFIGRFFPKVMKLFGAARKTAIKDKRKQMKEAAGGSLRKCQQCGKAGEDPKRCTGCYLAWYCGLGCQKEAWPGHSKECKITRKQYKKVMLVDYDRQMMVDYMKGGKVKTHNQGEKPSKLHFVIKMQVPQNKDLKEGLLLYNEERSISGKVYRAPGQEGVFDEIVKNIEQHGWREQKGYFYCILQKVDAKKQVQDSGTGIVFLEINTSKVLPPETW